MSSAIVYSNAFKLKTEIQPDLDSLLLSSQSLVTSTHDPSLHSASQASLSTCMAKISQLDHLVSELNELGRKEMVTSKREVVYGRVGQLRQDIAGFKETGKLIKDRLDAKSAELQRTMLLGSQITNRAKPSGQDNSTTILDMEFQQGQRLDTAGQNLDRYIEISRGALQDLYEQRDILKSTQRRLLDAANKLGLSSTVIRFIEQRSMSDKYILWGGIVISVVCMYFIVVYLG